LVRSALRIIGDLENELLQLLKLNWILSVHHVSQILIELSVGSCLLFVILSCRRSLVLGVFALVLFLYLRELKLENLEHGGLAD